MASPGVDQKYLGIFAKNVEDENPLLAAMLYKILGLSVILSRKLYRARRHRRLDPTRETTSLTLYHQIIWLSREGLSILEQWVLPEIEQYTDLKVLCLKLRASFYHAFVLFHNHPATTLTHGVIPSFPANEALAIQGLNGSANGQIRDKQPLKNPPGLNIPKKAADGRTLAPALPPGLTPVSVPKPTGSFLLPAIDYIPIATSCFTTAVKYADKLLTGSHPIRLSVKVEYAAFMYDCQKDAEGSRRLARQAIMDVYRSDENLDDQTYEEASELVNLLGKMVKRGLNATSAPNTPQKHSESKSSGRTGHQRNLSDMDNPF
jgi:hypothetical protein